MTRRFLLPLALLLCAAPAAAQQIRGDVREVGTGKPIGGAVLTAVGPDSLVRAAGLSEPDGSFRIDVPAIPGLQLRAQHVGYATQRSQPITLGRGDTLRVSIGMRAEAVALEGVTVRAVNNANLRHFLRRREMGFGRYIGPEEIAMSPTPSPTLTLLAIPGSGLTVGGNGRNLMLRPLGSAACPPDVYVDGYEVTGEQRMARPGQWGPTSPHGQPGITIETFVPAGRLRAVEVYRNPAQAPGEYQRPFMKCGVVVIWTDYGFGFEVPSAGGARMQDSGEDSSSPAVP